MLQAYSPTSPDVQPGTHDSNGEGFSVKIARRHCLDCCAGNSKAVIWCTCTGLGSTRCNLWPFRFGQRPETFRRRFGPWLLVPECMPGPEVDLDDLPGGVPDSIAWFREHRPEVVWAGPEKAELSPGTREALAKANEARRRAPGNGQDIDSGASENDQGRCFSSTRPR